eukprot:Gb_17436 [translate_table: standard]
MGGQKRGRTQRKHFRQGRENVWKKSRPGPSETANEQAGWEPFVTANLAFEEYYKEQAIVPKGEWDDFLSMLQKPLPATFRINSSGQFAGDILSQLENEFVESLNAEEVDGSVGELIKPLPWYPDKLAWHLNVSRMQLRKNQTLERFHEFLKQENEIGNITRQEAVSMVPPLFLDVEPHHHILDMCAAPGSKTFQLLEMIHRTVDHGLLPGGMIIANDVDVQRCNLLIHQTKRMCSANLMVTNHEAQNFPRCHHNKDSLLRQAAQSGGEDCTGGIELDGGIQVANKTELLFDRILCDVPCSGDGTIRKAPDIWRKWNAGIGNGVHRLQVQIAMRGVALLKVGGKLVYSTCSMNPVEDEAVVGEILRRSRGSMELLDVSAELPQLKRHPGLKSWKVRDRGHWLTSYSQVHRYRKASIVPSMFPSGKTWEMEHSATDGTQEDCRKAEIEIETILINDSKEKDGEGKGVRIKVFSGDTMADGCTGQPSDAGNLVTDTVETLSEGKNTEDKDVEVEEEVASLPLERCMRIMPHDQDTGAFFIAVFQKISPFTVEHKKPKEQHGRRNASFVQVFTHALQVETEVDTNKNQTQSAEIDDATPSSLLLQNDTLSQQDVYGTQSETMGNDLDALNAPESICTEVGNVECEIELGQTIDGSKNGGMHGEDRKSNYVENQGHKGKMQQQGKWRGVDPVLFFTDENAINSIVTFYGINESFPLQGHLVMRNSDTQRVKRIYYVSKSVHDAIKLNFCAGQQLKITSVGLKMFERQAGKEGSSPCDYRISSEGLPLLLPYLTKQVVYASKEDFKLLLSSRTVYFTAFHDPCFGIEASNLLPGCCVVVLREEVKDVKSCSASDPISNGNSAIAIGCWKGRTNLGLMLSKLESEELLERISFKYGNEMSDLVESNDNDIQIRTAGAQNGIDAELN